MKPLTPHDPATYNDVIIDALQRWGSRIAFEQPRRNYTYTQTADLVARMMSVLWLAGIKRGSAVGIFSINAAEAWMAGLAVQLLGGYCAALPPRGAADDVAFIAADAELSAIVVHPKLADQAAKIIQRCPNVEHVFTLGPSSLGRDLLQLAEAAGSVPQLPDLEIGPDDTALLWYSGGTTGVPKGAVHTQRTVLENALRLMLGYEIPSTMRYLAAAPISHSGYPFIAPTLIRGGTVVVMEKFDPDAFLHAVEAQRITFAIGVPTMLYNLLEVAEHRTVRSLSLERFVYGGAPISPDKLAHSQQVFGNIFTQMYGQAESLGGGTALLSAEHDLTRPDLLASCGRPVPGVSIRLLDVDNNPTMPGEIGEICLRARSVMTRYWKQPEATAECFSGGWLHTGDLARVSEDGYYTIVDRKKDMIVSGGFNVYPAEIERVLGQHPDVHMCAVIGVPDPKWGEAVKALVVPKPGSHIDVARLISLVREKKGAVHAPKTIELVDSLALTPTGKVDKKALRAKFWQDKRRNVN